MMYVVTVDASATYLQDCSTDFDEILTRWRIVAPYSRLAIKINSFNTVDKVQFLIFIYCKIILKSKCGSDL